jgi:thiamine biosynthesis lipoprotein
MGHDKADAVERPEKDPMNARRPGLSVALLAATVAFLVIGTLLRGQEESTELAVSRLADDRYETKFLVMGTEARYAVIVEEEKEARRILSAAIPPVRAIEAAMSTYQAESEVSRLNRSVPGTPIGMSRHSLEVFRAAIEMSRLSGGAFDVTYAPLRTLWRGAQRRGIEPTDTEIAEALTAVGSDKLRLEGATVALTAEGMEVDLGGIAKGYAIDLAVEALQEAGARSGIVDIGGDLRLFGLPEPVGKWRIRVRRPPEVQEDIVVELGECAVTTSGDYERWFSVGEKRFSHIVDPRSGRPVARVPSVTIIAPDATTADGLATALSVMGPTKGLRLVDGLPGVECLLVERLPDGSTVMHMSAGFAALME